MSDPHAFGATKVLMQLRTRPEWQALLYSAPGGKVEPGEWPSDTMYREFEEETGLALEGWRCFCTLHCATPSDEYSVVYFFLNWASQDDLDRAIEAKRESDEPLAYMTVRDILADDVPLILNIRWLIQMARNLSVGGEWARHFEVYERYDTNIFGGQKGGTM